ncbi:uncharacterized protein [Ptychodera flava]|uniref:uncharacterized protein n=1 Tax=Ptychodera flava TaxID=63121 RepID=UPI00396A5754
MSISHNFSSHCTHVRNIETTSTSPDDGTSQGAFGIRLDTSQISDLTPLEVTPSKNGMSAEVTNATPYDSSQVSAMDTSPSHHSNVCSEAISSLSCDTPLMIDEQASCATARPPSKSATGNLLSDEFHDRADGNTTATSCGNPCERRLFNAGNDTSPHCKTRITTSL